MTAKTDLPPLPERFDCTNGSAQWCYGCYTMTRDDLGDYVLAEDYDALRNVSEALQAEIEALRAEVERVTCELMDATTRADKLAEALRKLEGREQSESFLEANDE